MSSHPNRSKGGNVAKANPTPAQVRAAREAAGHSKPRAAALIYATLRAWENWEAESDEEQARRMHPGLFELYLLKMGQLSLAQARASSGEGG